MNQLLALAVMCGMAAGTPTTPSPDPKSLAISPQDLSKAQALVRKLGSDQYREREDATAELAKMGRLAKPALLEGVSSDPDPEVRFRCSRLLPKAEAADLHARIETFLADADGKYEHDLPAWKAYRAVVGADRPARDLYVEMLKADPNRDLLVALDKTPEEAGRAVADRRMGMYLALNPGAFGRVPPGGAKSVHPTLVDIATLIFGEAVVPGGDIPANQFRYVTGATFVQNPVSQTAVTAPAGTPHGDPYRRIMTHWLDTRTAPDDLSQAVNVATLFRQLPQTTPLLRRIVTTDGVQMYARSQALVSLVQRNGKDEMGFLRTLLANDAQVGQAWFPNVANGGRVNQGVMVQMRDLALAYLVTQTGQQMKDFGFEFPNNIVANPAALQIGTFAFTSDEARVAAFKKWDEWTAAQMKTAWGKIRGAGKK